jgi:hypothetical protein
MCFAIMVSPSSSPIFGFVIDYQLHVANPPLSPFGKGGRQGDFFRREELLIFGFRFGCSER